MRIYLAIKYHPDQANRPLIEALDGQLRRLGHETHCVVRDLEAWGEKQFSPQQLMQAAFRLIDASDWVLIELSEKGVGLGIEAGYAHARGIPIRTIARAGSEISETLRGISRTVLEYNDVDEIVF